MKKINDHFYPTPLPKLLKIILSNLEHGHILGFAKELFFFPKKHDFFKTQFFGQNVDSPIGVAAGPHTQLSQNIVIAWLAGARFIELKTIQTLDELDISKPCIDMQDEGYNCEWSQELKIYQAFEQYLDAWIIIHILSYEFGFDSVNTIFNMSVGYDMQGILKENVQWFLKKMQDASKELQEKIELIKPIYPKIDKINIPTRITDNITLSTMHGCPPDEVEEIATYLIKERKLNTIIKLNPTLLGKEQINKILKNSGFHTQVPDIAFEHDLTFEQASAIVSRMLKLAEKQNVFFGIKLTNTLEAINNKKIFDTEEMYMSGRALHPISINLARKFQNHFDGKLKISFSGGVDAFNIINVLKSGLAPITVSSDLLKPGGYGRLAQYYEVLRKEQKIKNYKSINDLIAQDNKNIKNPAQHNLNQYADYVLTSSYFKKQHLKNPNIKTNKKLEKFDCIFAPCQYTCPTNQDVPEYMYYTATKQWDKAFQVILEDNPFPSVLGFSCDHTCQSKCTQMNYTESLEIRQIKRFIAEYNYDKPFKLNVRKVDKTENIAIIGGGPAGLSAAFYLRLYDYSVEIFEASQSLGGMLDKALPLFRLPKEIVKRDIERILEQGVKVHYNTTISKDYLKQLEKQFDDIIIAIGAQINPILKIPGYEAEGILNALQFLYDARAGKKINLGKKIAVIGGGNTAMDTARVAKRLIGEKGKVIILYRRTKEFMPAQEEEIFDTLKEGIEIIELVEPNKYIIENGKVKAIELNIMKLKEEDNSPRPRPIATGKTIIMEFDTVIPAIGQEVEKEIVKYAQAKGYQTIGDAENGGLSIVKAVADGKLAAYNIIRKKNYNFHPWQVEKEIDLDYKTLKLKRYKRTPAYHPKELSPEKRSNFDLIIQSYTEQEAVEEANRCLVCNKLCDICTTVCPNMANQHYELEPRIFNIQKIIIKNSNVIIEEDKPVAINQKYQTLNIADWCNECGNCTTFCPTSGRPYADKPRLHLSWQSYSQSPYGYYVNLEQNIPAVYYKDLSEEYKLLFTNNGYIYQTDKISLQLDKNLRIEKIISLQQKDGQIKIKHAVEMLIIKEAYSQIFSKN